MTLGLAEQFAGVRFPSSVRSASGSRRRLRGSNSDAEDRLGRGGGDDGGAAPDRRSDGILAQSPRAARSGALAAGGSGDDRLDGRAARAAGPGRVTCPLSGGSAGAGRGATSARRRPSGLGRGAIGAAPHSDQLAGHCRQTHKPEPLHMLPREFARTQYEVSRTRQRLSS